MPISVGVGTGGSVSVGSGSNDASVGGTEGVPAGPVTTAAPAEGDTDADGDGVVDAGGDDADGGAAGLGADSLGCAGALPSPPAPPGPPIADDLIAGVASCQPIVTAMGSPNATSPIKMDLGDNRT